MSTQDETMALRLKFSVFSFGLEWLLCGVDAAMLRHAFANSPWVGEVSLPGDARARAAYRRLYVSSLVLMAYCLFKFGLGVLLVQLPSLTWLRSHSIAMLRNSRPIRWEEAFCRISRIPGLVAKVAFIFLLMYDLRHLTEPAYHHLWNFCVYMVLAPLAIAAFCLVMVCAFRLGLGIGMRWFPEWTLERYVRFLEWADSRPDAVSEDQIESVAPTQKLQSSPGTQLEKCAVCREELVAKQPVRQLPCRHVFHAPCVDSWLKIKTNCPTCRRELFSAQ
jgi:E3 ubiquitin-protein ligase RNF115/126